MNGNLSENTTIVETRLLEHCPWNPREDITPESVSDLVASIKTMGILHDIGVMEIPKEERAGKARYWVVFGNRRLVAARAAEFEHLQVKVFKISKAEAMELTRAENEVRMGVSAIKDAELVKRMLDLGMTEVEIAAHYGVSVATVCRRAKLTTLSDSYKELEGKLTTAALERIAAYPEAVQKRCLGSVKSFTKGDEANFGWGQIGFYFERESRDLVTSQFWGCEEIEGECRACNKRTGIQADMFGYVGESEVGRCLDRRCFDCMVQRYFDKLVEEKVDQRATERVEVDYEWQMPNGAKDRWTKAAPCAYWCKDRKGVLVRYGMSYKAMEAMKEADRKMNEQRRLEEQEERRVVGEIEDKMDSWMKEQDPHELLDTIMRHVSEGRMPETREVLESTIMDCYSGWNTEPVRNEYAEVLGCGLTEEEVETLKKSK